MIRFVCMAAVLTALVLLTGCKKSDDSQAEKASPAPSTATKDDAHGHDHSHDEEWLGDIPVGDISVNFYQGHGKVEAGKEGHLIIKLPYSDEGATIVRAWIGTEDRMNSIVGKADYAKSHDDYDVHAMAPDPLPENVMWWVEIEKPDGTKLVGSVKPIL